MNTELVSVVVPVYKVNEKLLRKSIESILNQSYRNIQLLVVDDGSPDDSGKICDDYARLDTRITVFHIENGGVSNARNYALDRVSGDYIMFVDSDDYIEEDYVEILVKTMHSKQADCVMCSAFRIDEATMEVDGSTTVGSEESYMQLNAEQAIARLCYMDQPYEGYDIGTVWGTLYKASLVKDIRFNPRMRIGEDFEYKFRTLQRCHNIVCIERKLYNYLICEQSAMRNGFDAKKIETVYEFERLVKAGFENQAYADGFKSRAVNIAIVILFMVPIQKKYKKYREDIKRFIYTYRADVLKNPNTRKKVRVSLWMSYLGLDFTQRVFFLLGSKVRG